MTAAQRFRKKPVEIEAYQWWQVSPFDVNVKRDVDYYRHPPVDPVTGEVSAADNAISLGELKHSDPAVPERFRRERCDHLMNDHGYIHTLEGGHTVCPGDWIITGVQGERYPCKPDIFAATYEAASGAKPRAIDVEIVENLSEEAFDNRLGGILCPRKIRINGTEVLVPADHPCRVEKLDIDGRNAAMVTLTLFVGSLTIKPEVTPRWEASDE